MSQRRCKVANFVFSVIVSAVVVLLVMYTCMIAQIAILKCPVLSEGLSWTVAAEAGVVVMIRRQGLIATGLSSIIGIYLWVAVVAVNARQGSLDLGHAMARVDVAYIAGTMTPLLITTELFGLLLGAIVVEVYRAATSP